MRDQMINRLVREAGRYADEQSDENLLARVDRRAAGSSFTTAELLLDNRIGRRIFRPMLSSLLCDSARKVFLDMPEKELENLYSRHYASRYADKPVLERYIGQKHILSELQPLVSKSLERCIQPPHVLLVGPPGMGKFTLARETAEQLDIGACVHSHDRSDSVDDVVRQMADGDALLIENIERFGRRNFESLRSVIDFGKFRFGTYELKSPLITVIASTCRPAAIPATVRRFFIEFRFAPYSHEELTAIVRLIAVAHGLTLVDDSASLIASASHGSPEEAAFFIRRLCPYLCGEAANPETVAASIAQFGRNVDEDEIDLRQVSGEAFEEWVANVLHRLGCVIERTGGRGDHGIDLFAHYGTALIAVQCKNWADPVGEPVIRDLIGSMTRAGASHGFLVAVGSFTKQAYQFVNGQPVRLLSAAELQQLSPSDLLV